MTSKSGNPTGFPKMVRPVRKAYEQVADQLEELVFTGVLADGQKLPGEHDLAAEYGVSRATVREALRVLAARSLIRTGQGVTGGSFITIPSVNDVRDINDRNITLLSATKDVTLQEFLEARELLEVPAAELAAQRRTQEHLDQMTGLIPGAPGDLDTPQLFGYNKGFHSAVVAAACNGLITISAQPIFSVLQTHLARTWLTDEFHIEVNEHHRAITAGIARQDVAEVGSLMRAHLDFLRPFYEKSWVHAKKVRTDP